MVPVLALLLATPSSEAVPFPRKAQQDALSDRQIDREETLPRGWMQLELRLDHKSTSSYRDFAGVAFPWDPGATWNYSRATLAFDQGFSDRTRLYLRIPYVWARLANDNGANISTFAPGDVAGGVLVQPWLERRGKLAFRVELKAPSGVEWPGSFASGPDAVDSFLTGTGITNLGAHVHTGVTLYERVRLGLNAGYTHKFAGIVGYVVEADGFANGWVDPGDAIDATAEVQVQIVDGVAVALTPSFSFRMAYKTGVSGEGNGFNDWFISRDPAAFVDLSGRVDIDTEEQWGLTVEGGAQLAGGETLSYALLGLEEFSPQPGAWAGFRGRVRF